MIKVVLYTKPGCHLCEDAKALLLDVIADHPDTPYLLEEVDIRQETAVHQQYWDKIPVIQVGTAQIQAPIQQTAVVNLLAPNEAT